MRTLSLTIGLVVILLAVSAQTVAAHDNEFYWSSTEATLAVGESDWAADRKIRSVSCRGRGVFRRDVIDQATFRHFRCALRNASFRIVAHVTMHTTAPEQFQLTNLTNRLKVCR